MLTLPVWEPGNQDQQTVSPLLDSALDVVSVLAWAWGPPLGVRTSLS